MRLLIQKCLKGSVFINNELYNEIEKGYVIFVGFTENDNIETIKYCAKKVANLRIFEDEKHVMNQSILDVKGSILSISQFTLYADTTKGNRPSYIKALNHKDATLLYDVWNSEMNELVPLKSGVFGSDMIVNIQNDGPTTIFLEK